MEDYSHGPTSQGLPEATRRWRETGNGSGGTNHRHLLWASNFQSCMLNFCFFFFQPVVVFDDSPRRSSNRRDGCLVSRSFSLPLPSGVTFQLLFTHKSCGTQIALHTPGLGRVSWPGGWSWLSAHLLGGVGATYSSPGSFVFYSLTKVF